MSEQVLCITKSDFNNIKNTLINYTNNLSNISIDFIQLLRKKSILLPRDKVENDDLYLQVIPVTILTTWDTTMNKVKVFYYTRYNSYDKRLEGKSTVLVGGHSHSSDMVRELSVEILEELFSMNRNKFALSGIIIHPPVALIYTQEDKVSSYHIGIVFCSYIKYSKICYLNPSSKMKKWQFVDYEFLQKNLKKQELWSKIISKNITLFNYLCMYNTARLIYQLAIKKDKEDEQCVKLLSNK